MDAEKPKDPHIASSTVDEVENEAMEEQNVSEISAAAQSITAQPVQEEGVIDNNENAKESKDPQSPSLSRQKPVIEPIFYDLKPCPTADAALKAKIEEERQKQLDRVSRFSKKPDEVTISPVTETTVLGARRAAIRHGFATGFDTTSPEEERKRQARIARFGPPESHPHYRPNDDDAKHAARARRFGIDAVAAATEAAATAQNAKPALEVRRNPSLGEKCRDTVIHLFGVDQLGTRDVMKHFSRYGPSWCEWLNDSSCNLAFEDAFTMRRALHGLSIGSTPASTPTQSSDALDSKSTQIPRTTVQNLTEEKLEYNGANSSENKPVDMDTSNDASPVDDIDWRPLRPFALKGRITPLWGRMATAADIRPEKPNPNSKWSRTMRRQQRHEHDVSKSNLSTPRRKNSRGHGVKKDVNAISKTTTKKSNKMDIDRALSSS